MLKRLTFEKKKGRKVHSIILGGLMFTNSLFCMPNTYSVHFSADNDTIQTSNSDNKGLFTGFAGGFALGSLGTGLVYGLYTLYHSPSIVESMIKNMNRDNCIVLSEIMYNEIINEVDLNSVYEKKLKSKTKILNSWNKKLNEIFEFGKYHQSETFKNAVDNFIDIIKNVLNYNGIEIAKSINNKDPKIVLRSLFSLTKMISNGTNIETECRSIKEESSEIASVEVKCTNGKEESLEIASIEAEFTNGKEESLEIKSVSTEFTNSGEEQKYSLEDDILGELNPSIDTELLKYCRKIDYLKDNDISSPSKEYRNDVCICRCYDTYYVWIPKGVVEHWKRIPFGYYDKMLTDEEELKNKPQITQNGIFYDTRDFTFWNGKRWLCVKHFIGAREPSRTNRPKYMTEYAVFEELNSGFDTELLNNCMEIRSWDNDSSIPKPAEEYRNDLCICTKYGGEFIWSPSEQCWRRAPLYSFNRLLTNEEELRNKPPIMQNGIFYDKRDLSYWDGTQWLCVKHFIGAREPTRTNRPKYMTEEEVIRELNPDVDILLLRNYTELHNLKSSDNSFMPESPTEEYRNDLCICRYNKSYYIWIPSEQCWNKIRFDYYAKLLTDEEKLRTRPNLVQNRVFYSKCDLTVWDGTQWLCMKHFIGAREPSRADRPTYMTENEVRKELQQN